MYQVLYRKWRPAVFSDVIGQEQVTAILKNQVAQGKFAHAYLFCGTRGSGKTTCARILAKAVNCLNSHDGEPCGICENCQSIQGGVTLDITEIDAASNNGVNDIRALRDESVYTPANLKLRVYIIDEVHMLSGSAFNALLKLLEEPPEHILFILATTETHKVPATILSRCQRFDFRRIRVDLIADRLKTIAAAEGWQVDEEALRIIARLSDGAMRNALSLLEQAMAGKVSLSGTDAEQALGLSGGENVLTLGRLILQNDLPALFELAARLYDGGIEVAALFDELFLLMRDLLMLRALKENATLSGAGYDYKNIAKLAEDFPTERLVWSMRALQEAAQKLSGPLSKRAVLELCLYRLCEPSGSDNEALSARLAELEARLEAGVMPAQTQTVTAPSPKTQPQAAAPAQPAPEPSAAAAQPAVQRPAASGSPLPDDFAGEVAARLKKQGEIMTAALFERTHAVRTEDKLLILCPTQFEYTQLNHSKVLSLITDAAEELLGGRLPVGICVAAEAPAPPPAKEREPGSDPLAALMNEFDGIVTIN